jgi:peptidyl-tRNA hydrolase
MTVSRNIRDFTDLICECLSLGWQYTQGQPTEADLQHWASFGRSKALFKRCTAEFLSNESQTLHLIRCKEEASILAGYKRLHSVGLWTAWIEDRVVWIHVDPKTPLKHELWI